MGANPELAQQILAEADALKGEIEKMGSDAVRAAHQLALLDSDHKNRILNSMADELWARRNQVTEENAKDVEEGAKAGLSEALVDRLLLNEERYESMVEGLRDLTELADPVGTLIDSWTRPNGLEISRVRVPIGVIAMIYESRPNVTADAAGLVVKTSNAVILRGGSESLRSNRAIQEALQFGGEKAGLPKNSIQLITSSDRAGVGYLVQLEDKVDLAIPRGGEGLIRAVAEMARVPVLKHYKGVCHTYVDRSADLEAAVRICENAKCQRPGVCNAMETLLVHSEIAPKFLPLLCERLIAEGVELRGDSVVQNLVPNVQAAVEEDWFAEYLDLTLAIRVVSDVAAAVEHINSYGSRHTDVILAEDESTAKAFVDAVDSGVVMVNTSSRFNDGAQFGLGAEIGISTDKLHARGPVGPEGLTTYKYVVRGSGQIRE